MREHGRIIRKRLDALENEAARAVADAAALMEAGRVLLWVLHLFNDGKTIPERDIDKVKAAMKRFGRI